MKKLLSIAATLTLVACSSNAPVVTQTNTQYNPENQARVRLYGQNGHPTMCLVWH